MLAPPCLICGYVYEMMGVGSLGRWVELGTPVAKTLLGAPYLGSDKYPFEPRGLGESGGGDGGDGGPVCPSDGETCPGLGA